MNEITEFFRGLFSYDEWPPRWNCGYWSDFHGWVYIISELMVWTAYFMIPLLIIRYFFTKGTSIRFRKVYLLFATFILLCGSTHFLDAMMFWIPMYRFNAVVRLSTGIVSLFTVYHLFKVLPDLFKQKTNVELEREIRRREVAEQKLAEANKGLAAFAYIASHDLQEPARKIRTFGDILYSTNEATFDERSKGLTQKIIHSAARMQTLIQDVLALSTISEEVELIPVDATVAVQTALEDLEVRIREKGAVVNYTAIPLVKGNEAYLTQLFLNLIGNAIKFSDQQPIVNISAERTGEMVQIRVSDNGIGMRAEDQEKIFRAFERLHGKREYEGTGIGLAICKRIADVHEGSILVNSKPGEGTTFIVTLQGA